jgi:hypothetical protein
MLHSVINKLIFYHLNKTKKSIISDSVCFFVHIVLNFPRCLTASRALSFAK